MKTFDIIIPHFNSMVLNILAGSCVKSIRQHSKDYRVIWVQNGGMIPEKVNALLDECEAVTFIQNKKNLGFVKATNAGIAASDAPFVVLLNNDTVVTDQWLTKLKNALTGDIGISGPLCNAGRSWQGRWTRQGSESVYVIPDKPLAFFCTMIRRDVIEKVGLLDERFGMGLGDDDDYCDRARKTGFKIALVQDLRITHKHRSTFRTLFSQGEIHAMQRKALARLHSKSAIT